MMMFILSAGLVESGLVAKLGYRISKTIGDNRWRAVALFLLLVGVVSAFLNNTAAVAVFMPVGAHLARHYKFSPSKILMPLSFTAIFGGTCTLLGTSTNLLVSALSDESGTGSFEMFEFFKLGAVFMAVGLAYNLLVPVRFLPSRAILSSLTRKYHLSGFLTEVKVSEVSKLVGHTVLEEQISERFQMNVLEIIRGHRKIYLDIRSTALEAGDILLVRGAMEDIVAFKEHYDLLLLTDIKLRDDDLSDEHTILAEMQLSPTSRYVGSSLKEIDFRKQFGCFVLALARTGGYIRDKLASIPLHQWDTLLVFGPRSRIDVLSEQGDFVPLGERDIQLRLAPKWWISALVIPLVVILAAAGIMPILKAAILGSVSLLVTRSITISKVYRSIDWTVIFLLAAILPLGLAMQNTGLANLLGEWLTPLGVNYGPRVLLSLTYLFATLLTSIFSNNATAVLMVPIVITAATELGISPKPFLMAVAYAASASFMTPVGYQTNAMVMGPGNYKFLDYVKFGTPLTILFWLIATFLIPVFWPF